MREQLLDLWPEAINIRYEGKCHCRANALMSFHLPGDNMPASDPELENCGFWCGRCGFSNAGARQKEPLV